MEQRTSWNWNRRVDRGRWMGAQCMWLNTFSLQWKWPLLRSYWWSGTDACCHLPEACHYPITSCLYKTYSIRFVPYNYW